MWKYIILMLIFLSPIASAATIHGTTYDFGLNILKNIKIKIDTTPQQTIIAKDGKYSFNVPEGDYTIKAEEFQYGTIYATAEEQISIIDDGNYILDLILFQNLDEDVSLLDDIEDINPNEIKQNKNIFWALLVVFIIISIIVSYFSFKFIKAKKTIKKVEEKFDSDLEKLIHIIRKEGGRITQKDIRKRLGLSEAKISLMITELEHKQIVKRIKKGRSNIIILN